MEGLDTPTDAAAGVTVTRSSDKITVTIMTTPSSDARATDQDTRALWSAAYTRLRGKHTEELTEFERQAYTAFRLQQRRNSSNALAYAHGSSIVRGLHNMAPDTVLDAVRRWISEARAEEDVGEEEEGARRTLSSTLAMLSRNMQESPAAHLAWVAASLCIRKLVEKPQPAFEAPGLAYIVAHIAFYDRLSQLALKTPGDNERGPNGLHEALIKLYAAVLEQLTVVIALDHAPRRTRAQQKQETFDHPDVGATVHPIIALELSLGLDAGDKTLEESIAELVRLRAPSPAISDRDDHDACEAVYDTMTEEDDDHVQDDDDDDDDCGEPSHSGGSREKASNAAATADDDESGDGSRHFEIQRLLCVVPREPPSPLPPAPLPLDGCPTVLEGLHHWALKQDAYQRWRKVRSADHGNSDDRILWLHGPEESSTTLLLRALAQAENENPAAGSEADGPRYKVASASWDWSRNVNGTSVVSILRDLVWTVLADQPPLQEHLAKAVQATGRRPLLCGDSSEDLEARYAALGTSCDFYAMLVLLCSIVRDKRFAPTCFVVDYRDDELWDDGDGNHVDHDEGDGAESCRKGRDAGAAQKRAWTFRDLIALVRTTCRDSCKVAWILRPVDRSPPSSSIGGFHLDSPEEPLLGKIMRDYIRDLLQSRTDSTYISGILGELEGQLSRRAGGNVTWAALAVDLVGRVQLPWNAIHVLPGLPDSSTGLGPLLDYIIQCNVNDSGTDSDRALVNAAFHTAALAFQPLTVSELAALAFQPPTVAEPLDADAATILLRVLARPLLELRDAPDASGYAQTYVYYSTRAVLAAQRARLAKATAVPDLHADMVCRHLLQLQRHYRDTGRGGPLSPYMKLAWLRHLDHAGIGRTDDAPVTNQLLDKVRGFVERNASAWLRDMDELGIIAIVRRMLQDLLPTPHQPGRLSPMQAKIKALFTHIWRAQEEGMSLADYNRFMRVVGINNYEDDGDLPVRPQVLPLLLPPSDSLATAFIGTLDGHDDWVRDTHCTYDNRLIVSISDDNTLRCWDRASCRIQHVKQHTIHAHRKELSLSPADPNLLFVCGIYSITIFDLASGVVSVAERSLAEIRAEWRKRRRLGKQHDKAAAAEEKQQDEDAAAEEMLGLFSGLSFAADGSNDVVANCGTREVVLGMPGLGLKEVRLITKSYDIKRLSWPDCEDAVVASSVELAAVIRNDGDLFVYSTKLEEGQQTPYRAHGKFTAVQYFPDFRAFFTSDESDSLTFLLVHERGEQAEQGEEREPTKQSHQPLIRSYKAPQPSRNVLSFALSGDRDEVFLTSISTDTCQIYKVMEADADADADADARINTTCLDNDPDVSSPRHEPAHASSPLTMTLFSHDGLRVATSSKEGRVQLWNLPNMATGESDSPASDASAAKLWRTLSESSDSEINWLCFSSDDSQLLACYDNGETVVWDTETGERVAIMGKRGKWVKFATFSPRDALVVTAPYGDAVHLWDLKACRDSYRVRGGCFVEESDDGESNEDSNYDNGSDSSREKVNNNNDNDDNEDNDSHNGNNNDGDKTTPRIEQPFVTLEGATKYTMGGVAFSPDGLFLATPGSLGHIWDISPDPTSSMALPKRTLRPCATLCWKEATTKDLKKDEQDEKQARAQDENEDYGVTDDDDEDVSDDGDGLNCNSFVFSPDSHSLFGFCSDGRLFVWKRTSSASSSSSPSSSSSDSWQPRATVLADGFKIPDQDSLWTSYQPRRLSISQDADSYLLHTEVGVWVLPSRPANEKIGLQPSTRHPCSVVATFTHRGILWQNQWLTKLPRLYWPSCIYSFQGFACDVRAVDESTSTLLIGTSTGRLLCLQFRGKKMTAKATEVED